MAKISYVPKRFSAGSKAIIDQASAICDEYAAQGFVLTLRQLFYQFVSRDFIKNNQQEYKRLGAIVNDARLAGQIDWDYIQDRTRNLAQRPSWEDAREGVRAIAEQFHIDMWANQPKRVEVWIEKDALVGVIETVCQANDVPFFSCRGYTSQSEMWTASMRIRRHYRQTNQETAILHLGDHDPSGLDMSRDIEDRLNTFRVGPWFSFRRLALHMEQIQQYNPPPNFAKVTDARYANYEREYGTDSWELDALEPQVIYDLIEKAILSERDDDAWLEAEAREQAERDKLDQTINRWDEIEELLAS